MDDDPLDTLQWNWGEFYRITRDATGRCLAARRDGLGEAMDAKDPEELNKLIADDYAMKPVKRNVA